MVKTRSESDESPKGKSRVPSEMVRGGPRSTSLESYHDDVASGKMESRGKVLLRAVMAQSEPATGRELAAWLPLNVKPSECLDYHAIASVQNHLRRAGLIRYGKTRACGITGRNAHPYEATENAQAWLEGFLEPIMAPSRSDRKARIIKAARAVYAAGKPIDGNVVVPMELMVDLSVALTRIDDKEN